MQKQTFLTRIQLLWGVKKEFREKVLFLALSYALLLCCQAIWRPLKTSIFSKIVGPSSIPDAKLLSLLILAPLIILYSYIVDRIRRHQIVYLFCLFHAIGGALFYFLLTHPIYGVANTSQDTGRLIGWFFYIFMESFNAFLSASFWSFVNSINNPKDGKNHYGIIVAGSKVGGLLSALFLYTVLTTSTLPDHVLLPNFLFLGSVCLLLGACGIFFLMRRVPGYYMHGYEAAYRAEKKKGSDSSKNSTYGAIEGFWLTIKNPYVFGTFSLILFYDVMVAIFDYRLALVANAAHETAGALTAYYALYYACMHGIGLLISLLGTTPLQRLLGIRFSLFVFPVISFALLFISYILPYAGPLFIILVLLRAFNYGLNHPTREMLYIPTNKAIKFKAKAWADAFGSRIGKACGSAFNVGANAFCSPATAATAGTFFTMSLNGLWIIVVYFLGKTLEKAIKNKRVIGIHGLEEEEKDM